VIDPQTLTPESLYRLQSETWSQGADYEKERIIKLAQNRICFDHKISCDHAACYSLSDLIAVIKEEIVNNNGQEGL
jgi:hypothetical protein